MKNITVLFPGGFKPITAAHLALAERYAKHPKVARVILLIGPKQRDSITQAQTIKAFNILNNNPKINIESTSIESPIAAVYEYLFTADSGTYALAAGGKDDDYTRVSQLIASVDKYKKTGDKSGRKINPDINVVELKVSVAPITYSDGTPISASSTRAALANNDIQQFKQSYPGFNDKQIERVYKIYKGKVSESIFTRTWWNEVFEGLEDPKDNPCWKGYKPVGTKKKGGKTVPNCVPESVNEVDLPANTWKDFDLRKLTDDDLQIIWDMYTNSYAKQGLDFSADDYKELQQKYKAVYLQDVDSDSIADAFIVYKETPYGNRISLLGTNNKPEAKLNVVKQLIRLVNTNGWFAEASKKVEEIMQRSNAPVITDKNIIQAIAGDKEVKFLEDGYYERKLSKSSTRIVKRLYGKPKTSGIRESKLNEGGAGYEYVTCMECNRNFRQITPNHLHEKHSLSLTEYIERYPYALTIAESLRQELVNKNSMHDARTIEKIKNTKLERYGDKGFNNIQKQQRTIKERYNVTNVSQLPHNIERAKRQLEEIRQRAYASGRWTPASQKQGYIGYRDRVRLLSDENFRDYNAIIENANKRGKKWHLDHIYSIHDGFKNNIPEWMIAHPVNLRVIFHSLNESKNNKSHITLKELIDSINMFDSRELLLCGGAGGHMAHPFDIPSVKTGKDLVRVFVQAEDYLTRKPASVKIDGVNASVRLVDVAGKRQFVLDRGSNKPLDVKGITKADLLDRFGAGHGMIEIGGKVLDIFNDALNDTASELKKLGLWDNPNILFNIEYVAGSTNVLSYNKNFLAIHGLLEIEQVTPKRRATHEIAFNKKALQTYIDKLAVTANTYGYEVLGSVPTTLEDEPDFNAELKKRYTININGKSVTKTLNDWLLKATNPKDVMIKTKDGKTINALSKQVLMNISNGMDVSEFIQDPKDYQTAINGFAFYLATMKLGDAVLEVLNSPLGKVSEHEGVVIRDPKIFNKPFKITGKFIVRGLESSF